MKDQLLHAALRYAEDGWRVFPLLANGKTPATEHGFKDASTDGAQIREWFGNGSRCNLGIATGNGLVVIDVDVKHGVDGFATLAGLDLGDTRTATTPSGGQHRYYTVTTEIPNSAGALGPGIDTRGDGGYVVAPPSTINGTPYTWEDSLPMCALSDAVVQRIRERHTAGDFHELDAKPVPIGMQESTLNSRACSYRYHGLSREGAIAALWTDVRTWEQDPTRRPWTLADIETKVERAWQDIGPGAKVAKVDRPTARDEERRETLRAAVMHGDEIGNLPKPRPLIDGILDLDTLAAVYGPSGCGKSFIAVDFGAIVATGGVWQGVTVAPRAVLYVTAEGAHGMGDRLAAWSSQFKDAPNLDNLHWLPSTVSLYDAGWADALAYVARELRVELVIIDTLARSMAGGDENSTQDMSIVIGNADALKRATGACVLFVHHTGWGDTGHARGSSAFKAALDTELEVKRSGGSITLKATKQRHREDGQQWPLRLEPREASAVVVRSTGPTLSDLRGAMRDTLDALTKVDTGSGASSTEWRRATSAGVSDRTFYNHRRDLLALGLAEGFSDGKHLRYRITDAGRDATTATGAVAANLAVRP